MEDLRTVVPAGTGQEKAGNISKQAAKNARKRRNRRAPEARERRAEERGLAAEAKQKEAMLLDDAINKNREQTAQARAAADVLARDEARRERNRRNNLRKKNKRAATNKAAVQDGLHRAFLQEQGQGPEGPEGLLMIPEGGQPLAKEGSHQLEILGGTEGPIKGAQPIWEEGIDSVEPTAPDESVDTVKDMQELESAVLLPPCEGGKEEVIDLDTPRSHALEDSEDDNEEDGSTGEDKEGRGVEGEDSKGQRWPLPLPLRRSFSAPELLSWSLLEDSGEPMDAEGSESGESDSSDDGWSFPLADLWGDEDGEPIVRSLPLPMGVPGLLETDLALGYGHTSLRALLDQRELEVEEAEASQDGEEEVEGQGGEREGKDDDTDNEEDGEDGEVTESLEEVQAIVLAEDARLAARMRKGRRMLARSAGAAPRVFEEVLGRAGVSETLEKVILTELDHVHKLFQQIYRHQANRTRIWRMQGKVALSVSAKLAREVKELTERNLELELKVKMALARGEAEPRDPAGGAVIGALEAQGLAAEEAAQEFGGRDDLADTSVARPAPAPVVEETGECRHGNGLAGLEERLQALVCTQRTEDAEALNVSDAGTVDSPEGELAGAAMPLEGAKAGRVRDCHACPGPSCCCPTLPGAGDCSIINSKAEARAGAGGSSGASPGPRSPGSPSIYEPEQRHQQSQATPQENPSPRRADPIPGFQEGEDTAAAPETGERKGGHRLFARACRLGQMALVPLGITVCCLLRTRH